MMVLYNFNTSNVNNQLWWGYCLSSGSGISIHLMLIINVVDSPQIITMLDFNTSNVNNQPAPNVKGDLLDKFQYI